MSIPENLAAILARIDAARKATLLPAPATRLVAVSKTVDADGIRQALAAGQRVFGENRVQEAQGKFPALKADYPGLKLHLIGPLQTNKVKEAMALYSEISAANPAFKKIYEDYSKFRKEANLWFRFTEARFDGYMQNANL